MRGIMFLAHPAMREWADHVAQRLNGGLALAELTTHGQVALAHLQVDLEARLRSAGLCQRSGSDSWCAMLCPPPSAAPSPCATACDLQRARSRGCVDKLASMARWPCRVVQVLHKKRAPAQHGLLGQPLASSATPRAAVSQIAHIDVVYNVAWPLNVVITEAHMQRCRQMLSAFLQVRLRRPNAHADACLPSPDTLHPDRDASCANLVEHTPNRTRMFRYGCPVHAQAALHRRV